MGFFTAKKNTWEVFVALFTFFLALAGQAQTITNFTALDIQLHAAIANTNTPDDLLLESISRLGKITEPPSFWTQIADNTNYSLPHRTRAVFALFRRHGERCGDIQDLRRCLAPAKWLDQSSIQKIPFVFGFLPVEVNSEESIFSISVFYGPKIYIRLRGDVDYKTFVEAIRGEAKEPIKSELIILQCGYADDYEQWLVGSNKN